MTYTVWIMPEEINWVISQSLPALTSLWASNKPLNLYASVYIWKGAWLRWHPACLHLRMMLKSSLFVVPNYCHLHLVRSEHELVKAVDLGTLLSSLTTSNILNKTQQQTVHWALLHLSSRHWVTRPRRHCHGQSFSPLLWAVVMLLSLAPPLSPVSSQ